MVHMTENRSYITDGKWAGGETLQGERGPTDRGTRSMTFLKQSMNPDEFRTSIEC